MAGEENAVAPRQLGRVEPARRRRGSSHPALAMRRERRDTCADGDRTRHSRKLPFLYHLPQFFSDRHRLLAVGLGQQDGEFLSAVSADHIDLAQLLVKE